MNIDSWLIHTATVATQTGRSGGGDPTFGPQTTVRARIERNVRMSVGAEEVLRDVHAMVTRDPITVASRVWFPGDDTSSPLAARRPLATKSAPTRDGSFTLYETYFAA